MTIKRLLRVIAISSALVTVLLSLIVVALAKSQSDMNRILKLTYESRAVAEEIRRHSEYMRQLVRLYIMAGDTWWANRYREEHQIRAGLAPGPDGVTASWLERYQEYGFSDREVELLAKHDLKRVPVTEIEQQALDAALAYHQAESPDAVTEAGYRSAVKTVFGDTYRAFFQIALNPLQDFVILIEQRNDRTFADYRRRTTMLLYAAVLLAALGILWLFVLVWQLTGRILTPLSNLQQVFHGAIDTNLQAQATPPHDDEIGDLFVCYNTMIGRIKAVMEQNVREQQNRRRAELNILQSQINPHFLYNTLDTIVWMAEINDHEKVVGLATSLSAFFRISLSRGHERIPLRDEIEHVENYLSIQKIRYEETLSYEIRNSRADCTVLVPKLTLQPLVENAIYHGIKRKRGRGRVTVTVGGAENVEIVVEDDGVGMDKETLAGLEEMIRTREHSGLPRSFGLYNTFERLRYHYGDSLSVQVDSVIGGGTQIALRFPGIAGDV